MKYLKNIKSYEELKNKYRELLKENHPDNGGDLEVMKEINVEYDALFPIWKNRKETESGAKENNSFRIWSAACPVQVRDADYLIRGRKHIERWY